MLIKKKNGQRILTGNSQNKNNIRKDAQPPEKCTFKP